MKLGLSHIEIRSFLKVGGYRCSRVYNISSNREKVDKPRHHALNANSLAAFRAFMDGLDVEDGYPCSHRRPKFYVLGEKVTWKMLYNRYEEMIDTKISDGASNLRKMAKATFYSYKD